MSIGAKIKKIREEQKLTQEEFAKKINISRSAVAKWEQNRGNPDYASIEEICIVFNVSKDELINNEDIKKITLENQNAVKKTFKIFIISGGTILAILLVFISYFIINNRNINGIEPPKVVYAKVKEFLGIYFSNNIDENQLVNEIENKDFKKTNDIYFLNMNYINSRKIINNGIYNIKESHSLYREQHTYDVDLYLSNSLLLTSEYKGYFIYLEEETSKYIYEEAYLFQNVNRKYGITDNSILYTASNQFTMVVYTENVKFTSGIVSTWFDPNTGKGQQVIYNFNLYFVPDYQVCMIDQYDDEDNLLKKALIHHNEKVILNEETSYFKLLYSDELALFYDELPNIFKIQDSELKIASSLLDTKNYLNPKNQFIFTKQSFGN